jgi:hypothetical protein
MRIEALEKKIDEGFAEMRTQIVASERALRTEIISVRGEVHAVRGEVHSVRSDARSDFRTLIAVVVAIWVATLLSVVGLLASHL